MHRYRTPLDSARLAIDQANGSPAALSRLFADMPYIVAKWILQWPNRAQVDGAHIAVPADWSKLAAEREGRRQAWLEKALDPWAAKHELSREQAISVLFYDYEGPTLQDVMSWNEVHTYGAESLVEAGLTPGYLARARGAGKRG